MKIVHKKKKEFKDCEFTATKKVLINICDYLIYGLTDSNSFYRNLYVDPPRDYENSNHKLGDVIYSHPLSYHTIANIVCVALPKTSYNIIPFRYNSFKTALNRLKGYIKNNDIHEIHTPIFGTKIIEGDWNKIMKIFQEVFDNLNDITLYIYES